jgi:predicted nucleotidyltransferase component of viral defense system
MFFEEAVECKLLNMIRSLQKEDLFKSYVLAGGTALALQIGHRISTDIDLFTDKEQNYKLLLDYFQEKYGYYDVGTIQKDILRIMVNGIKIDLVKISNNTIEAPCNEKGVVFFGKKDIAAMKLRAIMLRTCNRDFIDIAYLMKEYSLDDMFDFYKKKYGSLDIAIVKCALLKCNDIKDWNEDIKMIKSDMQLENIPFLIEHELRKSNDKKNIGIRNIFKLRK